jgi:hypothetical protein
MGQHSLLPTSNVRVDVLVSTIDPWPWECRNAAKAPSIRFVMALSLFAAQAVLEHYLDGRVLPDSLRTSVVHGVETRFIDGATPVLDKELCKTIDGAASALRTDAETLDF